MCFEHTLAFSCNSRMVVDDGVIVGMGMPDPVPTFSEVVTRIRDDHPGFAYIHVLEPTTDHRPKEQSGKGIEGESNKFLRDIWGDRPYIANYSFERDSAIETVEQEGGLISFGRHFISNVKQCLFSIHFPYFAELTLSELTARSATSPEREY